MSRSPAPKRPPASARPWASVPRSPLRRFLDRRRRTLAAVLLCLAAGAAVHELTPPSAAMAPVAVAARDLAGGATVSGGDLRVARLPADAVPQGASSDPSRLVGQRLAGPVRGGEAITDAGLVGPGLLAGTAQGTAAVPVRVADPASLQLLRPGQLVDVMLAADAGGPGTGTTLAAQVPVLWAGAPGGAGSAGPWLGSQDAEGLLVVAARPDQALRVAGASARGKVFFTLVEAGPR
ncbi:Flp pilus assembly protein CpaB [Sinomonas atrocyanea]|uniref:RcpC/CpaB family pilus assembly protein n=1 Tax=Sinomonas atrocyanea TaxID=37927 RepID=UPI00277F2A85|nr:RcpC/CpaB family pilus assembly protein [Sinomonas atrocyanea]MDP9885700.1 Flp pilus assembly protein CpaB [Sinomonas atrocyanea]